MISAEVVRKKRVQYPVAFRQLQQRFLPQAGKLVEGAAKTEIRRLQAIDTGRLRGSVTFATRRDESQPESPARSSDGVRRPSDNDVVHIGTNVEYAAYVEYGTARMAARPYLRNAIDFNRGKLNSLFTQLFKEAFRGT